LTRNSCSPEIPSLIYTEIYEPTPTSPTAEFFINFYALYVYVIKHGGLDNITHLEQ
jgi:hypothetical protein